MKAKKSKTAASGKTNSQSSAPRKRTIVKHPKKYASIEDYVPEPKKAHRQVLYMADSPNSKLSRKFENLPIFWNASKAKEMAKKMNGQYVKVELIW